jgi:hypothetical protein
MQEEVLRLGIGDFRIGDPTSAVYHLSTDPASGLDSLLGEQIEKLSPELGVRHHEHPPEDNLGGGPLSGGSVPSTPTQLVQMQVCGVPRTTRHTVAAIIVAGNPATHARVVSGYPQVRWIAASRPLVEGDRSVD